MARLKNGIKFGDYFVVDPTKKSDLAVVSHAHSDHIRSHRKLIATPPTVDLAGLRYKKFEGIPIEYHRKFEIGPATIEFTPAGHMLGSAQVLIDWRGERIVYTGDFKLEENCTCPGAEIHSCDILLIDTTYGMPHHRFPPLSECRERLLEFVAKNLASGVIPVIMAYSLGKAQEAMMILSDEKVEMEVHQNAYDAVDIYRRHGVVIEGVFRLSETPMPRRAVILPPGAFRYIDPRGWGRFRSCFLSGWTLGRRYGSRGGNSYGIPFSDHASFDDIVRYVETAKPKRVYTLFGPPNIAEYLRRIGFRAEAVNLNSGRAVGKSPTVNGDLFE